MTVLTWIKSLFSRVQGVELSYSKVKSYLDCPWLYRTLYVELKKKPPTPGSSMGLSVHRALEAYHRENGGSLERLLELYDERWVHAGFPTPQDQMAYYERGRRMLERYWEADQSRKSKILFVEKEFQFDLGPHKVRGIIDRVDLTPDGRHEIIDYKTQQEALDEDRLRRDLQLGIYGIGLKRALGLNPSTLNWLFLAHGKMVSVPYDPLRERDVLRMLEETGLCISRGAFGPDTAHCPRCDFRQTCPYSTAKDP